MVGGGQLARMTQPAAVELGVRLAVLAERADDSAAQVIPATMIGSHLDAEAVTAFARGCDVLTFDHEHVPTDLLHALEDSGVPVRPGPDALVHAQDKAAMRARLADLGVPVPRWALVRDAAELAAFAQAPGGPGWPVVLKTTRGGYDGKGVLVVSSVAEAADWLAHGEVLLAEERVAFSRELAALVARSPSGQAAAWPVVETLQVDGADSCLLYTSPSPRDGLLSRMPSSA